MASFYKRKITRGQSYDLTVSYDEDGVAQSIVGDALLFTTKTTQYDNDQTDAGALVTKTVNPVPDTTDAQGGNYTFNLDYDDTWQEPGTYFTDVWIVRADTGKRYPLALEKLVITGTPTNRQGAI